MRIIIATPSTIAHYLLGRVLLEAPIANMLIIIISRHRCAVAHLERAVGAAHPATEADLEDKSYLNDKTSPLLRSRCKHRSGTSKIRWHVLALVTKIGLKGPAFSCLLVCCTNSTRPVRDHRACKEVAEVPEKPNEL